MRRVWEVADDTLHKRKTSPADLFLQGDTMTGMQWGKIPDTKGWIVPVEKKN